MFNKLNNKIDDLSIEFRRLRKSLYDSEDYRKLSDEYDKLIKELQQERRKSDIVEQILTERDGMIERGTEPEELTVSSKYYHELLAHDFYHQNVERSIKIEKFLDMKVCWNDNIGGWFIK